MPYQKKSKLKKTRRHRRHAHKKHTLRRRKGGRSNPNHVNNNSNDFEERLTDLINTLQDIISSVNIDDNPKEYYIDQILLKLNEARLIDEHYGNHDMEDQIAQRIADVLVLYDQNMRNREISNAEFGQIINRARQNYINQ